MFFSPTLLQYKNVLALCGVVALSSLSSLLLRAPPLRRRDDGVSSSYSASMRGALTAMVLRRVILRLLEDAGFRMASEDGVEMLNGKRMVMKKMFG